MTKKPLMPRDFPVSAEDDKVITDKGKPIAETESEPMAREIADRLNQDEARKEEDRWSA